MLMGIHVRIRWLHRIREWVVYIFSGPVAFDYVHLIEDIAVIT